MAEVLLDPQEGDRRVGGVATPHLADRKPTKDGGHATDVIGLSVRQDQGV